MEENENVVKYQNWKAITESDYVTMFIKTWFAFVATLRDLNPRESLDDIIGKGDGAFITPFLEGFEKSQLHYNDIEKVLPYIIKVYNLGRNFVLENKKYHRFFLEDFFTINNKYTKTFRNDRYIATIKKAAKNTVSAHIVFIEQKYEIDHKKIIIDAEYDFSELLVKDFDPALAAKHLGDESKYAYDFSQSLYDKLSIALVAKFIELDLKNKYSNKKIAEEIESIFIQLVLQELKSELLKMTNPDLNDSEKLFYQLPFTHFIDKTKNNSVNSSLALSIYSWFIKFVYFIRNALFHEIIDPLDQFWQELFKNAYLALKEILDGNISYFLEREKIYKELNDVIWNEIQAKPEQYTPDYNGQGVKEKITLSFLDYQVLEEAIKIKAEAKFFYNLNPTTLRESTFEVDTTYNKSIDSRSNSSFKMVLKASVEATVPNE